MKIKYGQQNIQTVIPVCPRKLCHEFNNALTVILGNAEILSQDNLTFEQAECINDIKASGQHLLEFVRGLLRTVEQTPQEKNINSSKVKADSLKNTLTQELSILVVEDEPFIQKVHGKMLMELGCHVEIANDGCQALDKLTHKNDYKLVFMDINMPKMGGIEAVEIFRQQENKKLHVPIVGLTAYEDEEIKIQCKKVGFDNVVTKPITSQVLKNILRGISKQKINYQII